MKRERKGRGGGGGEGGEQRIRGGMEAGVGNRGRIGLMEEKWANGGKSGWVEGGINRSRKNLMDIERSK